MVVNGFEITDALRLERLDPEEVLETCRREGAKVWLDLRASEPAEIEEWLGRLEIIDLSRWLCLEARGHPGFYPFKNEIFFVIPVLIESGAEPDVEHVAFLCRENLLLTLHREAVLELDKLVSVAASDAWLPGRSVAGLVSALVGDQLPTLEKANRRDLALRSRSRDATATCSHRGPSPGWRSAFGHEPIERQDSREICKEEAQWLQRSVPRRRQRRVLQPGQRSVPPPRQRRVSEILEQAVRCSSRGCWAWS